MPSSSGSACSRKSNRVTARQIVQETREEGFLLLPDKPLVVDEALSRHYLELHDGPAAKLSPPGKAAGCYLGDSPEAEHRPGREQAKEFIRPPRSRPALPASVRGRLRWRRTQKSKLDATNASSSESEVSEVSEVAEEEEEDDFGNKAEKDMPEKLRALAEGLVRTIPAGRLLDVAVQHELAQTIQMQTKALGVDFTSPLLELELALCRAREEHPRKFDYDKWQVDLTIVTLRNLLDDATKQEEAGRRQRAQEAIQVVRSIHENIGKSEWLANSFVTRCEAAVYRRLCQELEGTFEQGQQGPTPLVEKQEQLIGSLTEGVHYLEHVKNLFNGAVRLEYEAEKNEKALKKSSTTATDDSHQTEEFFEAMHHQRRRTTVKMEAHFHRAGTGFHSELSETKDLESAALELARDASETSNAVEGATVEYRELQEKLRATAARQRQLEYERGVKTRQLEAEKQSLKTRRGMMERAIIGHNNMINDLQKQISELMCFEIGKSVEANAVAAANQAAERRDAADKRHKAAKDRLDEAEALFVTMNSQSKDEALQQDLEQKQERLKSLSQEASNLMDALQYDQGRFEEVRKWLSTNGQDHVAGTAGLFVTAEEHRQVKPMLPKAQLATPIHMMWLMWKVLARKRRVLARRRYHGAVASKCASISQPGTPGQRPGEAVECPHSVLAANKRRLCWGLHREAVMSEVKPDAYSPPSNRREAWPRVLDDRETHAARPWRNRLIRSASEPPAARAAHVLHRSKVVHDSAVGGEGRGLQALAAAPRWRWGHAKVDCDKPPDPSRWIALRRQWQSLWDDALKIFQPLQNQSDPNAAGVTVAYLWKGCYNTMRLIRDIVSDGVRGLFVLQRLEDTILNTASVLASQPERDTLQDGKYPKTPEAREDREIAANAEKLKKHMQKCCTALQEGIDAQQDKIWFLASYFAAILSIVGRCVQMREELKNIAEREENLEFSVRSLLAAAKLPGLQPDLGSALTELRRTQRNVQLDSVALQQSFGLLEKEWKELVTPFRGEMQLLESSKHEKQKLMTMPEELEFATLKFSGLLYSIMEVRHRCGRGKKVNRARDRLDWQNEFGIKYLFLDLFKTLDLMEFDESEDEPGDTERKDSGSEMTDGETDVQAEEISPQKAEKTAETAAEKAALLSADKAARKASKEAENKKRAAEKERLSTEIQYHEVAAKKSAGEAESYKAEVATLQQELTILRRRCNTLESSFGEEDEAVLAARDAVAAKTAALEATEYALQAKEISLEEREAELKHELELLNSLQQVESLSPDTSDQLVSWDAEDEKAEADLRFKIGEAWQRRAGGDQGSAHGAVQDNEAKTTGLLLPIERGFRRAVTPEVSDFDRSPLSSRHPGSPRYGDNSYLLFESFTLEDSKIESSNDGSQQATASVDLLQDPAEQQTRKGERRPKDKVNIPDIAQNEVPRRPSTVKPSSLSHVGVKGSEAGQVRQTRSRHRLERLMLPWQVESDQQKLHVGDKVDMPTQSEVLRSGSVTPQAPLLSARELRRKGAALDQEVDLQGAMHIDVYQARFEAVEERQRHAVQEVMQARPLSAKKQTAEIIQAAGQFLGLSSSAPEQKSSTQNFSTADSIEGTPIRFLMEESLLDVDIPYQRASSGKRHPTPEPTLRPQQLEAVRREVQEVLLLQEKLEETQQHLGDDFLDAPLEQFMRPNTPVWLHDMVGKISRSSTPATTATPHTMLPLDPSPLSQFALSECSQFSERGTGTPHSSHHMEFPESARTRPTSAEERLSPSRPSTPREGRKRPASTPCDHPCSMKWFAKPQPPELETLPIVLPQGTAEERRFSKPSKPPLVDVLPSQRSRFTRARPSSSSSAHTSVLSGEGGSNQKSPSGNWNDLLDPGEAGDVKSASDDRKPERQNQPRRPSQEPALRSASLPDSEPERSMTKPVDQYTADDRKGKRKLAPGQASLIHAAVAAQRRLVEPAKTPARPAQRSSEQYEGQEQAAATVSGRLRHEPPNDDVGSGPRAPIRCGYKRGQLAPALAELPEIGTFDEIPSQEMVPKSHRVWPLNSGTGSNVKPVEGAPSLERCHYLPRKTKNVLTQGRGLAAQLERGGAGRPPPDSQAARPLFNSYRRPGDEPASFASRLRA